MKHSPEPWEVRRDPSHFHTESDIYAEGRHIAAFGGKADEQEENTRRAVACVNAMAGIVDPVAFVVSHARLLKCLKHAAVGAGYTLVKATGCLCASCETQNAIAAAEKVGGGK